MRQLRRTSAGHDGDQDDLGRIAGATTGAQVRYRSFDRSQSSAAGTEFGLIGPAHVADGVSRGPIVPNVQDRTMTPRSVCRLPNRLVLCALFATRSLVRR